MDEISYLNTEVFWVVMLCCGSLFPNISNYGSALIIRVKLSKILFFLCIILCVFNIYN